MRLLILCFCCIACTKLSPVQAQIRNDFTTTLNRAKETKRLRALVDSVVQLPIEDVHAAAWKSACWAMELMLYAHPQFEKRLPEIVAAIPNLDASLQWSILEAWYTLYPGKSAQSLVQVWPYARSNKIKALLLQHYSAGKVAFSIPYGDAFISSQYYQAYMLHQRQPKPVYRIKDVEQIALLDGQALLVSVQYRDRNKPGFLMIRDHGGRWLKDQQGKILQYTQLARSITNLPYYLTNGNTPQGLYRITGTDVSDNAWIGPTKNLQMVMPFELPATVPFFRDTTESAFQYAQMLGKLSADSSLWQSYYAGLIGRSEIIAHGTTIPTEYYVGKLYYPNTPSLGCLCSPETWDASGTRRRSVQEAWMAKLETLAMKPSYLLVIEVLD